jgi:hypothetical protein
MLKKRIGDFYLIEQIGAAGKPGVYLALNPRTREKRAVKLLNKPATTSEMDLASYLREIDLIRGLSHPNIVKIVDRGTFEDFYYYAMEYMPGGNLSRALRRGRVPLNRILGTFGHICDAVAYAHEKGIAHRALKPSNILRNASGEPMVSDFALIPVMENTRSIYTLSNEMIGTMGYLAPEQRFNGRELDRRVDVYALGAILYDMVMGVPPLGEFPWPCEALPEFPEALQNILRNCLANEPSKRYAHAGLLLADLIQFQKSIGQKPSYLYQPIPDSAEWWQDVEFELPKDDRIERWFQTLRSGSARERLAVLREMIETMEPQEAKAILKLYPGEEDRVRWGLIRVLGELRITAATSMIIPELKNPFHRECAIEALGKIGADEAFVPIREYVMERRRDAAAALLPLARTGKAKAIQCLRVFMKDDSAALRQAATRALAAVATPEALQVLKTYLDGESDSAVREAIILSVHHLEAALSPETDTMQRGLSDGDEFTQPVGIDRSISL